MSRISLVAFLTALLSVFNHSVLAQSRMALVIGNKDYAPSVGRLANPLNDAKLVSDALKAIGFRVTTIENANQTDIFRELSRLARELATAGQDAIGFFYYSGHGVSRPIDRTNYLVPTNITDLNDPDVWWKSVSLDFVLNELQRHAPNATLFLVFDACRSELQVSTKGGAKGFVPIAHQSGVFIATSTGPNATAADDPGKSSGPYALALARELQRPGQDHLRLFQNVKSTVWATTNPRQVAWETNGLVQDVILNPAALSAGPPPRVASLPPPEPPVRPAEPAAKPATAAPIAALYEEDSTNPQGRRYAGSVRWQIERTPEADGGRIRADVSVRERALAMTMLIRQNTDQSLPVSHFIEIEFKNPQSPGTSAGVQSVPGLLMKTAEQARGVPLVGVPAKITSDLFMIGLTGLESDIQRNLQALKDRPWIDIPIVYDNNTRAVLALEKGDMGEKVFAEALTRWTNPGVSESGNSKRQ